MIVILYFVRNPNLKSKAITSNIKVYYNKAKYLSLHDYLNTSQNNLEGDVY